MKKICSTLLVIACLCAFASPIETNGSTSQSSGAVYICTGGSSTRYHRKADCWGLQSCKGSIKKVTKEEAEKKYHRTPCKVCYKNEK